MRRLVLLVALASALVLGTPPAPAEAQEAGAAGPSAAGLYITVRPSLSVLDDLEFTGPAGTDEIRMTGGFGMSGALGYRFSRFFRADLELAFRSHAIDEYRPAGGPDLGLDGIVSSGALLANAYMDVPTGTRLTPYIGGGIGAGYVALDSDDRSILDDETDGVFAYQAAAGVQVRFTPLVSLFGGYRYFATTDPDLGRKTEYRTHNLDAGLRFDF